MKNKILKKIIGIFGYRLIEKRLFKNNRTLSKHTSFNIKKILEAIFANNKIEELIQIGANDGVSFDELNFFIKKYKTKSLLVEPIKNNFNLLKENYKDSNNISFENSAISINNEISYLYKVNPKYIHKYGSHIPAIPSFNKNHLINHGVKNKHIVLEKVVSLSILDLINKHKFNTLDLLFIDCEGYDGKIVFDFLSTVEMSPIIIFEFVHIENEFFEKVLNKLLDKDYRFISVDENVVCYPKSKKINISLN
jgi:FkbM family methyltransferase